MTTIRDTLRNVGIIAHVDAGKTTLTERVLHLTGQIHASGEVHHGNTTTDFDPEEQKMGITISAAAVSCAWRDAAITLIDTPGHIDFTIEVERSLRVLDGGVLLIDAVSGVEPQTETVWRQAMRHGVSAVAFINKLDRSGADFDRALRSLRAELGGSIAFVPVQCPIGAEDGFVGVVDLVGRRALRWGDGLAFEIVPLPPDMEDDIDKRRSHLVEAIAERDDALLDLFVEGGDVSEEALRAALRRCTLARTVVPVLAGSAYRNRGVQPLLDAIVDYLPAPEEKPPVQSLDGALSRERSVDSPLAALCFKVSFDDHGALCFVRVFSGVLRKGDAVHVAGGGKLRVGRIVRLFADQRHEVDALEAGQIGALLGANLVTGRTLCAPDDPIVLESVQAPPAVIQMAIEPCTQRDRERLPQALARLLVEDPSLRVEQNAETGQTTLAGMGQLHLEIARSHLRNKHRTDVNLGAPRVAYRESVRGSAQVTHRHIKQSGGPGQYAVLTLAVAPCEADFEFVDQIRGGALPREYVRGVEKGCRSALSSGVLGGFPIVGVQVTLLDGDIHTNDSSEHVFELAAAAAFREACLLADPILLEPIMSLRVQVPGTCGSEVIGDIGARRGQVLDVDADGDRRTIVARVPFAELFAYAGTLGSISAGRGTHAMHLCDYAPIPPGELSRALR